jgi:hypothetical protein
MDKLGLYEYNQFTPDEQAELLWDKGVFLINRMDDKYSYNLYSLFDFFVEVWYDSKKNSIYKFRTFKTVEALEPYLDRINLDWKP